MTYNTPQALWSLSSEILALEDAIAEILEDETLFDNEKEEQTAALFDRWLGYSESFDKKAEAIAGYIHYLDALTEARKAEYRRIRELSAASERQKERMKTYLVSHMSKAGKTKIQGANSSLSLRKKPPKVVLSVEPEELPVQFQKIEILPKLNELKAHIKVNPDCEFAFMSTIQEWSLIIK